MEFVQLAFEALKERKLRSSLTILMVIVGVALLVGVDGVSKGARKFIEGEFAKFGTNIIVANPSEYGEGIDQYVVDEIRQMDGVKEVIPAITRYVIIEAAGQTKEVAAIGIEQSKIHYLMPELRLEDGTLVPETDMAGLVLGHSVAYNPDGTVFAYTGDAVRLQYRWFEEGRSEISEKSFIVRGVFRYFGSFAIPVDDTVWMSLRSAMKFFDRDNYDTIYVITEDPSYNEELAERISEEYGLRTITPQQINEMITRILHAIDMYIMAISIVSLLVASIGIVTTLYTSMLERIREIGVLKAIGFKNYHILRLFLYEALIIGVVGTVAGMIIGVFLSYVLKSVFFSEFLYLNPVFTVDTFVKASVLAISLSILSGLYPAWRASKLDPVVALRYE